MMVTAFGYLVGFVLLGSADRQMGDVDARRVIAGVKDELVSAQLSAEVLRDGPAMG
ncbi:hypothetical protein MRI28_19570 [Nocardiopsis dassonvillei]|nr:hypothetical protein [Nocardiopsis dassonvillei]MCK9871808.1 hypothetical protein [Nocardiopsis dassonvillei]